MLYSLYLPLVDGKIDSGRRTAPWQVVAVWPKHLEMSDMTLKKIYSGVWLAVLFTGMQWAPYHVPDCQAALAVIQVDHSDPDDITRAVSVLLSPGGRLSFDRRTRSLIVNDTPRVIAQVRDLVRQLDQPVPTLTIRVRMGRLQADTDEELTVEGRISGPGWSLGTPGHTADGVGVTLNQAQTGARRQSEYVLKSQSGQPAYIATGSDIPFTTRWSEVCRTYGGCRRQTTYKRVATGFEVLPVVRGRVALVRLTPRISTHEGGIIRFAEAATQIRVPLGRWVDIGQVAGGRNAAIQATIDSAKSEQVNRISMWMMIEKGL